MLKPLLAFWSAFAEVRAEVAGGTGLSCRPAPLNFANGVWEPDPNLLGRAAAWCEGEGLPPAAIVDAAHPLGAERGAERLLIASALAPEDDCGTVRLEQVGWNHTRPLAELIAYRYDRMDVLAELTRAVAGALEREGSMEAYLTYDADGAFAGGALALPVGERLLVVWSEHRLGPDPAPLVAGRFPSREAWRIETASGTEPPPEGALAAAARMALDG